MVNNIIIFLRHAETHIDKTTPAHKWNLTPMGYKTIKQLVEQDLFSNIDLIITSTELKSIETAKPFATKNNLKIVSYPELNEVTRSKSKVWSDNAYHNDVKQFFLKMDKSIDNWEIANSALNRIVTKFELIDTENENKKILIVSHGLLLTLLFSLLKNELSQCYERWLKTSFCAYGIIKDGKVIKDIIST
ncbi:MAG: histidine phosphatase family protein [Asgard group archaeon]|nr:histidine phosphatase family protein [Asgard group archaeon]